MISLCLHAQFYACVPLMLLLNAEGMTLHRTACIFGKTLCSMELVSSSMGESIGICSSQ